MKMVYGIITYVKNRKVSEVTVTSPTNHESKTLTASQIAVYEGYMKDLKTRYLKYSVYDANRGAK